MSDIEQLTEKIGELYYRMQEITLAAGVPVATYDKMVEIDNETCFEELEDKLEFLKKVEPLYEKVKNVWELQPPHIWQRLIDFGSTKLREQVLLFEAREKLRKTWRKKYGYPKPDQSQADLS